MFWYVLMGCCLVSLSISNKENLISLCPIGFLYFSERILVFNLIICSMGSLRHPGLLFPDKWKGVFEELSRDFLSNLDPHASMERDGTCLRLLQDPADAVAGPFSVHLAKRWVLGRLQSGEGGTHHLERLESLAWGVFWPSYTQTWATRSELNTYPVSKRTLDLDPILRSPPTLRF